jgi:3-mercaptopyruvate sulfurtransferase SseA
VAQWLRARGYRAYALEGGFDSWLEAGYPTDPKEAERGRSVEDICPDCGKTAAAHGKGSR